MTRKERQQTRIDRYNTYADNATERAAAAFDRSAAAVAGIPFGQPVIVGHHSEAAHRAALERSNNAMRQSVEESQKAAYYRQKAEAAANNTNIYLEDDDAIQRLEDKIAKLTRLQETMKNDNRIIRAKKMTAEEKTAALVASGHSEATAIRMINENIEWPTYHLANNKAKIKAAQKQLEKAKILASKEDKEYNIGDITVKECYSENRIRLYFPDKPDEETRSRLKNRGYRWAPSAGCWQAYINSPARWMLDDLAKQ